MQTIPNVATSDGYTDVCTLEDLNAVAATYVAANAAVIAQFRPKRKDGSEAPYGPELLLSPQSNNMVNVSGMRFRSAVSGKPAQVIAAMYDESDVLPGAATPFSQTITPSGSVVPGLSAVQVQHNGALVGSESTVDFVDSTGVVYTVADDPANSRVTVAAATPTIRGAIVPASLGGPVGTTLLSHLNAAFPIPAGTLGVNGGVHFRFGGFYQNATGAASSFEIGFAINGVAFLYRDTWSVAMESAAQLRAWTIDLWIGNEGSKTVQYLHGTMNISDFNGSPTTGYGKLNGPINDANTYGRVASFGNFYSGAFNSDASSLLLDFYIAHGQAATLLLSGGKWEVYP